MMSVKIQNPQDLELNDGEDGKQIEEIDEEEAQKNDDEDEETAASTSSSQIGALSPESSGLLNDKVTDKKNEVEDPVLLLSESDPVEDRLSLSSTNDEIEDPVVLPDQIEDCRPQFSGSNHLNDPLSLSPSTTNDNVEKHLLPSSGSSLADNSLGGGQVEDPMSRPPLTEFSLLTHLLRSPALDKVEDPVSLPSAKDKVEVPISLPSAKDMVEDLISIPSAEDKVEEPVSLPSAKENVEYSLQPQSSSDLVDHSSPSSTLEPHEVHSTSVCSIDLLSPTSEDHPLESSGGENSEEPNQLPSDHCYPKPIEIDHGVWSNASPTKKKVEEVKQCSPAHTNRKRSKDSVDSDTDSDVIYVEKNDEVIELSDDEAGECADLLASLKVPEDVISCLKAASNKVSLKLGDLIKNTGSVSNIVVEVPTVTWSLPWVCVSSIFKNPGLKSKVKKSSVKTRNNKSKRQCTGEGLKRKRSKADEASVDISKIKSTLTNIKKEKELYENSDRIFSVIHFDPNRPPEFCEISRSGRLIKKPTRLKDDMTFFRRTRRGRKKQEETVEEVDYASKTVSEMQQEPSTSEDKNSEMSDKSFENSMDSESCDRWMLGLNSDSENEEINVEDISDVPRLRPVRKETIELLSDGGLDPSSTNKLKRNYNEQKRRETIRHYFCKVLREITKARRDFMHVKASKIDTLNEALKTIELLETNVNEIKAQHKEMTARNSFLLRKLATLQRTLPK